MKKDITVATFGFVIMLVIMRFNGMALVTPISPRAIIDLEFADTPQRVAALLSHWDLTSVKMNIWLDFVFIASYVYFLFVMAERFSLKWREDHFMRQVGLFLSRASIVAGMFDVVENLLMLQTIAGNYTTLSLQLTFYCAAFKFILIGAVFLYFIVSVPAGIKR
ncbi:hypothetical protein GWC95_12560 [Sediminibacterium roseum]|uniref:Uncharacterized protein n=1 Tax=Sediminibacterium roseum TaxID=1978412 RepID=A0ABW9ZUD8_9BACT|nr:hypothetical protein [Sediminibacterium roseum]NCI50762.1 hypothetical protein [Sediminibacterium roseum]